MEDRITCLRCHLRINESANYCENCGTKVSSMRRRDVDPEQAEMLDEIAKSREKNELGQNLIFIGLLILAVTSFYYVSLKLYADFTESWTVYSTMEPVTYGMSALSMTIALFIAFGINAGPRKIAAIIIAIIYTLIQLYWFIDALMPDENYVQY